jgi:putative ABC transport system permease protein
MPLLPKIKSFLSRRARLDRELDEELESYVDLLARERTEAGADPAEARRRALLELGGREGVKEQVRARRVGEPFRVFCKDVGFGLRMLAKSPGFALVLVATLSIGIGATTAVFSVAHGVLLRSLPYPEADRLLYLWTHAKDGRKTFSPPDFVELVEQTSSFEELAAIQGDGLLTLSVDGRPEPVRARDVSSNFLAAYGVEPFLGRTFYPEEDAPVAFEDWGDPNARVPPGVVLISFELFRDRFGSDPGVLGKLVELDLHPYQIVGVTPPGFRVLIPEDGDYAASTDVWTLSRMDFPRMPRDVSFLRAVGRLRPDRTPDEAQAEASLFAARQRERFPLHRESGYSIEVVSLKRTLSERESTVIWVLLGAVALVLLIACANLASLLLSRWSARRQELAVRLALGASRGRLVRQVLTETLLYAVLGGAGGVLLSRFLVELFIGLAPAAIPRIEDISIDGPVLAFALLLSLLAALLVGAVPSIRFSREREVASLRGAGREGGFAPGRWDAVLVVSEVALAVVLVVGTALLLQSLSRILDVDPGFDADRVLTAEMSLSSRRYPRYPRADARIRFTREVADSLSELPGVDAVGLALVVPLSGQDVGHSYATDAIAPGASALPPAKYRPVTPGYLAAVGSRLLAGRDFEWRDLEEERLVTLVDERLAEKAWPGQDPLGKRLRIEVWSTRSGSIRLDPLWTEVVGVVENVRSRALEEEDLETIYVPYGLYAVSELSLLVRSAADPAALAGEIRERVARIDPDIAVFNVRVMDEWIQDSLGPRRFSSTLLSAFGLAGLGLALVGIYALLLSSVASRRRELGLRLALGARPSDVLGLVLKRGISLVGLGLALGLLGAAILSPLLASELYGVGSLDLSVYASVALLVTAVGLAAGYVPARQAARTDPMRALRVD